MVLNVYSCPFVPYNYSSQIFKGCCSKICGVIICNNVAMVFKSATFQHFSATSQQSAYFQLIRERIQFVVPEKENCNLNQERRLL